MKKHLIFCIAFLALLASCMKEPQIHRRLTDEEATAIPYHLGQTVNFVNQNDDTLTYTVVFDTTCLDNEMDFLFWSNSKLKMSFPDYYYSRIVNMECKRTNGIMSFLILPGKELFIKWEGKLLAEHILLNDNATESLTTGDTIYENVHSGYNTDIYHYGPLRWYYSEEVGLIAIKDEEGLSLTLIP